ncbi:hypothetical protein AB674_13520 [Flavobacterium sp. ABG]|nr:hypothetical protein AB674_13520 [Flavobacterium sp. ABG]
MKPVRFVFWGIRSTTFEAVKKRILKFRLPKKHNQFVISSEVEKSRKKFHTEKHQSLSNIGFDFSFFEMTKLQEIGLDGATM